MPAASPDQKNKLYYGDNLAVLRDHLPDNSVDLIYLDPPFNSRPRAGCRVPHISLLRCGFAGFHRNPLIQKPRTGRARLQSLS